MVAGRCDAAPGQPLVASGCFATSFSGGLVSYVPLFGGFGSKLVFFVSICDFGGEFTSHPSFIDCECYIWFPCFNGFNGESLYASL